MKAREEQTEEARRSLESMSRESGGFLDGPRMRGENSEPADVVEVWAKRIGRALGLVFVVLLAVNLFTGWFF